ncbi:MAG: response regulator transcription factor [Armatimonadetes bacterium]|nr:response regulator transcription factor [Anaerolineae bacterium]
MNAATRVMIVDDHRMVRSALQFALKVFQDLVVVGEARTCGEAVALCQTVQPNVALVDMTMGAVNDGAIMQALRHQCPDVAVIWMMGLGDSAFLPAMLWAGDLLCIEKSGSIDDLVHVIRSVG